MRDLLELKHCNIEYLKIKIFELQSNYGRFEITLPCGETCIVVADNDIFNKGWEHVQTSLDDRCLTWEEMCIIKDLFFFENEEAMQLHPARENYINLNPFCLHIWRPKNVSIPLPPIGLVVGFPEIPDRVFQKMSYKKTS